jgi:uncharacterized small protein (DUF1192 family)
MNNYFQGMIVKLNQKHDQNISALQQEIEGLKSELNNRDSSRREDNT